MEKSLRTKEFRLFSALLRQTRERAGITQVQLAAALRLTQSFVSKVERGECRLDIVQLRQFCQVLKTTLPAFIDQYEKLLASRRKAKP